MFAVTAVTLFNAQYRAAMDVAWQQGAQTTTTNAAYDAIVRAAQTMGALL